MTQFFCNKSLQNTHSKIEKSISKHLQKLDAISSDIKRIEEILAKAAISIDYQYLFDQSLSETKCQDECGIMLEMWRLRTDHLIVWHREEKRLMYETYITSFSCYDVDMINPIREPEVNISKPLIECRAHIRLKIEPELEFFYQGIDSLLGQGFLEETVRVSSPIFSKSQLKSEEEILF